LSIKQVFQGGVIVNFERAQLLFMILILIIVCIVAEKISNIFSSIKDWFETKKRQKEWRDKLNGKSR